MSNPCIGPNDLRYLFAVRKSDELWISRRLFVLSKIDEVDLMGQYLRDMWYMETLCPDDIREFMIIPIVVLLVPVVAQRFQIVNMMIRTRSGPAFRQNSSTLRSHH